MTTPWRAHSPGRWPAWATALLALCAAAGAPAQDEGGHTDRLIIRYQRGSDGDRGLHAQGMALAHEAVRQAGVQMHRLRATALGAQVMQLDRRLPLAAVRALAQAIQRRDPTVVHAGPDPLLQPQWLPDDPHWLAQWHGHDPIVGLNLPAAWDSSTGAGVVVAVLDTGYRPHADLAANLLAGRDFITDLAVAHDGDARDASALDPGDAVAAGECSAGNPARDASWHGTHVAGIVAAVGHNGLGVSGVAPAARLLPLRVLGKCGGYTSDIADAVVWASGAGVPRQPANATPARVINLSLGGVGPCEPVMQEALNKARGRNAVVVVAAGNRAQDLTNYMPANCAGVITVAAVARSGARASYSNFGAAVDLAAPGGGDGGGGILSTRNQGTTEPGADSYRTMQGTSTVAPQVSGVAALMLARNPALSVEQVHTLLQRSARPFPAACDGCGAGLADAAAAVSLAAATPAVKNLAVAEQEPNDDLASAQALPLPPAGPAAANTLVRGSLQHGADADHFRVPVLPGRTLTAYLKPAAGLDLDLAVFDDAGTLLVRASGAGPGAAEVAVWPNDGTAVLNLRLLVAPSGGPGSGPGTYLLRLRQ